MFIELSASRPIRWCRFKKNDSESLGNAWRSSLGIQPPPGAHHHSLPPRSILAGANEKQLYSQASGEVFLIEIQFKRLIKIISGEVRVIMLFIVILNGRRRNLTLARGESLT